MTQEGPKLYAHKPKKSKLKASAPTTMPSSSSSSSGAPAAPPPPPPPPPPRPPQPQKESFVRRYRFLWPLLLVVNFSIGAYVLMRTRQKDADLSGADTPDDSTSSTPTLTEVPSAPVVKEPIPVHQAPIPEDQQRELFRWMLEEKRKVKPKDAEEKKRIDEEKATLKQFIRATSLPNL